MTPNASHPERRGTDSETPDDDSAADLHPDVRAVVRATDALPVHENEVPVIELPTETGSVRASIPTNATDREAAVIAVALTAHLRDEAEREADVAPARADRWRLCNRVGRAVGANLRRTPAAGQAWKMAGRVRGRR